MKKLFFTIATLFCISYSFSQWDYKNVNNGFDDPYRIAYTSENNGSILKLEDVDGRIFFYIQGGYFCDEIPVVDFVFYTKTQTLKFTLDCITNAKNDVVFFTNDLVDSELYEIFKKSTFLKIRINQSYCDTETYYFNMLKSTSALNFMLK
jgi:hypothetical protein